MKRFGHGHNFDGCYYSCDTVVSGILCSTWHRQFDTHTARDRRNCNSLSAFDWKKDFEINTIPFFIDFQSKPKNDT